MRVRNWQRGSGKDAEGSADQVRIRPPVEESTGTALTEQPVLSARRWVLTMLALAGVSLLVMAASLRFGAEDIGFVDSARILFQALRGGDVRTDSLGSSSVILLQVRLPRVLLGFMVGGSLAGVGVGLQALLRNPLADPYVLGISSGAALGAAVAILFGIGTTGVAIHALPLCAFAGGLMAIVLVYRIAATYGRLPIHTLLLAGVILNAILSALIMFITSIMDPNRSFSVMFWLMGTLAAPDYPAMAVLLLYLIVGGSILLWQTPSLNLLTLGEESASSLGVEVETVKRTVFFTSALLTGAAVSMSGMIGFVGMVIPHAVRMVVGADHRLLLPASALVGGTFLVAADTVARTVLAPAEIPVGIVTALGGGPLFIYLLVYRKSGLAV
ncbi:MAG: iron ABC transporter permease [Nitrospirae bacterium]|nr:MAG: iron ABC transporter permease [Nitrospirota bacterium]